MNESEHGIAHLQNKYFFVLSYLYMDNINTELPKEAVLNAVLSEVKVGSPEWINFSQQDGFVLCQKKKKKKFISAHYPKR